MDHFNLQKTAWRRRGTACTIDADCAAAFVPCWNAALRHNSLIPQCMTSDTNRTTYSGSSVLRGSGQSHYLMTILHLLAINFEDLADGAAKASPWRDRVLVSHTLVAGAKAALKLLATAVDAIARCGRRGRPEYHDR